MSKNYYEILGVNSNATKKEIKKAFKQMSKKYHPDMVDGDENKFKEINNIYQVLSNDEKRKEYNQVNEIKDMDKKDLSINVNEVGKVKKQKKESRKERKDKKIQIAAAIGIVALLIISFVVSQNSKKIDPAIIDAVAVTEPAAHLYGNADAPLTLVEYSDFQCPACKNAAPQIKQLLAEYPDKFQLEYRHFPLRSIHPNAQIAAQAAEAAGMQGKFWEMHDMLFDRQSEWSESFNPKRFFGDYAVELGMSPERLIYDLESDKVKEIVNAQFDQASEMGLPGTPAFVLDGEQIDMGTFVNTHLVEETSTEEGETEVVENEITE